MNYNEINWSELKGSHFFNDDCMKVMQAMPDKLADLAIVDPPYGLQANKNRYNGGGLHTKSTVKFGSRFNMGDSCNGKKWDNVLCDDNYFNELFRVSKNQIIWGANYYKQLTPCRGFIIWDKQQTIDNFSACEYAYTSFDMPSKIFNIGREFGFLRSDKNIIHPTQKPIALYEWLLTKYAKKGDKILDTHMGSGSLAIACHNLGFDLTACELDKDYYEAAMKRINHHVRQKPLFNLQEIFINP